MMSEFRQARYVFRRELNGCWDLLNYLSDWADNNVLLTTDGHESKKLWAVVMDHPAESDSVTPDDKYENPLGMGVTPEDAIILAAYRVGMIKETPELLHLLETGKPPQTPELGQ